MTVFGINGWEFVILIVLAVVILGPERLPEYAAKLARFIRQARIKAEGAKDSLKEQLGPDYADINWRQYDPRLYDPRRIVREALAEPLHDVTQPFKDIADEVVGGGASAGAASVGAASVGAAGAAGAASVGAAGAASGAGAAPGTSLSAMPRPGTAYPPFDVDAT